MNPQIQIPINKDLDRNTRHAANRKALTDAGAAGFTHCLKGRKNYYLFKSQACGSRCRRMERTMRKLGFHCQLFVHGRLMVRNLAWYLS